MSYDVYLRCKCCGSSKSRLNPTYNLSEIFDHALTGEPFPNPEIGEVGVVLFGTKTARPRGLRLLNGKTGKESEPMLMGALERLTDPRNLEVFKTLEPENGWGNLKGAISVIKEMLSQAQECGESEWEIG